MHFLVQLTRSNTDSKSTSSKSRKQNWATEILIEEVNRHIKSPNFALFDVLVNI